MQVVLVSGYHGGSHQAWAEGYRNHSAHHVELLTLPARFWKWRMHGGAVTLARRFKHHLTEGGWVAPDLLLFTDMIDVSTFLALVRRSCPNTPAALYMHENQLTYPLPDSPDSGPMRRQRGERDLHYAFVNYASMLSADRIYFNSEFHRRELLGELPRFLRHFPEYNELHTVSQLQSKSQVLPVGVDFASLETGVSGPASQLSPLLIWSQRWEYDKNPGQFLKAMNILAQEGLQFRLAVCGENFSKHPEEFDKAHKLLADRIVHWGYATREEYARLLWQASATVSTAIHEFFGISILEAMYCQTFTALPDRLSYPEIVPAELHQYCLYGDEEGLLRLLRWAVEHPRSAQEIGKRLARSAAKYAWERIAPLYDAEFERIL